MEKELEKGKTLLVKGPSRIELVDGKVEVFGRLMDSQKGGGSNEDEGENELIIQSAYQYPLYAVEDSVLDIYTSNPEENVSELSENSIPNEWIEIKDAILKQLKKRKHEQPIKIMPLGLSRGKTSLCKYLANNFLREDLQGGYLDSDLGQQIMFVPTTLNIGEIKKPFISGKDIEPEFTKFIGATFPKETLKFTVSHECNNLIQNYIEDHPESDFIIIDTDGWIKSEAGLIYKLFFIKTVDPDIVIVFHDEEIEELKEIENKIKETKKRKLFQMEKGNENYYDKDKEDRRFLRQSRFSNILETFQKTSIPLDDIKFIKKEYDKENNEVIEKELNIQELIQLPYHYVLIALLDGESKIIKLGLLFSINLEKNYFLSFTSLTYKEQIQVEKVLVGSLRLSTKGNHQGYLYL
ncbi:MAG: hypothetical protein EU541_00365 [Promethearchaeota archaeon]|nr:MAG: hypothetical protein EU541_00365 [Candidatus Lokiarchaeota archaeon]